MGGEKNAFWNMEVSEAMLKILDLTPRKMFEDLKSKAGEACTFPGLLHSPPLEAE